MALDRFRHSEDEFSQSSSCRALSGLAQALNATRSELWFNDGNIVLIASRMAFKVHRGQLERHSEVFRDLFSVPQPPEADQELFDGCSCVELHDPPFDVFYLLSALYDGLYLETSAADDFPIIAGVLRLSSKYLIDHLRQRCLIHLEHDWPSTLQGWDVREQAVTDPSGRYSPRLGYPHPILIIRLAGELGLYDLLRSAFYDLSRYGPRRIISGASNPNQMFAHLSSAGETTTLPCASSDVSYQGPTVVHLDHHELRSILVGREHGQRYLASFIENELVSRRISSNCTNKHHNAGLSCQESFYYIMLNVLRAVGGISHGRDADPLFTLAQVVDMLSRTDFTDGVRQCGLKMCAPCKADLTNCVAKAREEVWELLPEWFGMHPRREITGP